MLTIKSKAPNCKLYSFIMFKQDSIISSGHSIIEYL